MIKREAKEWDESYGEGFPPAWDTGFPSPLLVRLVEQNPGLKGWALDVGCGTGTNAIYLSSRGFQVVGIDLSQKALKRAEEGAKKAGVPVHFLHEDFLRCIPHILQIPHFPGVFDLVFDRGCFHSFVNSKRPAYVRILKQLTRPGSVYLMICGSAKGRWPATQGPPKVRKMEILHTFRGAFHILSIDDTHFEATAEYPDHRPCAYACYLLRKP